METKQKEKKILHRLVKNEIKQELTHVDHKYFYLLK